MSYATQQRTVLRRVIEESERPLTAQEVFVEARKALPSLGMATVYRALKQFQERGIVRLVEIPGTAPHYEAANRHHHHFFLCQQCERLFNLLGCVQGINSLAPQRFKVRSHEIVLYGDCDDCLSAV